MTVISNLSTDPLQAAAAMANQPVPPAFAAAVAPEPPAPIVSGGFVTVTDAKGRIIKAKMLKAFDRMRLFKTLGNELASNVPYFGYAIIAASVVEIAGDPVSFPTTQLQLEVLVQRLDDDGLSVVSKGLVDLMGGNDDGVADTAKNY